MTISTAVPKVAYTGNGTTTVFPVPFEFFVNSDLYVRTWADYINNPTVFVTLVYGTDYTVTGGNGTTGSITTTVAPASGSHLEIADNVPFGQVVQYQAFGPFPAEAHERALDRLSVQIKQVANSVSEAVGGTVSVVSIFGRNGSVTAQQSDYSLFYSLNTHIHTWSEITAKPTLFPPEAHTHDWAVILNKPTTFPSSGHTHTWGEITDAVEQAQDMVAAMFVHPGDTGITFTYDDATGLMYAAVSAGGAATGDVQYNYSNSTSMTTDPGANNFRMNNATYTLVTQISCSNIDLNNIAPNLGSIAVNDIIVLTNLSAVGYARYTVTATDNTPVGYTVFTVACDTNNTYTGGPTNNNDFNMAVTHFATGVADAPNDGVAYSRKSLNWAALTWNDVAGKPTTFAPSAHTHPQSEVVNLVADLGGKANTVHLHVTSDVTGLDTALAGKASTAQLAAKADLASPVFTGNPTAPTPASNDNDTSIATTAFVTTAVAAAVAPVTELVLANPYATNTLYSVAHGLAPLRSANYYIKCLSNQAGYVVGDYIDMRSLNAGNNNPSDIPTCGFNATNVFVKTTVTTSTPWIVNKSSATNIQITPANWQIVARVS